MHRRPPRATLLLLAWLALLCALPAAAQQTRMLPEQIKAAYLVNFVRYTDWPPGAIADGRYRVAVVHDPQVAAVVRDVAAAAGVINGRTIDVVAIDDDLETARGRRRLRDELQASDVVFIGAVQSRRVFEILATVQGRPVLTVSDIDGFATAGGMLGLTLDRRHLVFDANRAAIQAAGLNVSAKVLTLARQVVGGGR